MIEQIAKEKLIELLKVLDMDSAEVQEMIDLLEEACQDSLREGYYEG